MDFEIIPGTSQDDRNFNPSVIFNQTTGGYALAFERNDGMAIALLDSTGKFTGSIVPVKNNPEANGYYDDSGVYCCSDSRILDFEYVPSDSPFHRLSDSSDNFRFHK